MAFLFGCGAGTPTPLEQAEVVDDGASQMTCVQVGQSRAAIDACRNAVKAYWCGDGGPLHEAGACTYHAPSAPKDGGGQ